MGGKKNQATIEALKKRAKEEFNTYPMRVWFRKRYDLTSNDPRYLSITDEEILVDFFEDQLWQEEQERIRKERLPRCPSCEYRGEPGQPGDYCPKCGATMETGDVYVDEEFEEYAKGLGLKDE